MSLIKPVPKADLRYLKSRRVLLRSNYVAAYARLKGIPFAYPDHINFPDFSKFDNLTTFRWPESSTVHESIVNVIEKTKVHNEAFPFRRPEMSVLMNGCYEYGVAAIDLVNAPKFFVVIQVRNIMISIMQRVGIDKQEIALFFELQPRAIEHALERTSFYFRRIKC